jgi:hypothetical protein
MPMKKKMKPRSARPAGKSGIAKKAIRPVAKSAVAKSAVKRTRKATAVAPPPVRARVLVVPPAEPLFRAAELDGVERRPARKAAPPPRPARPPARLPIPQSTYFF